MDDEDIEMVNPEAVEEEEGAVAAGGEGSDDQGGQEAEEAGTAGAKKVKNVVRRPQPKLNVDRLTSAKGLPVLIEMTKTTKFKGKGHELEDLDTILGVLDHWAHRTFPRFHSEFFYQRLESLGKKRQLQVYLRRLRLGLEDGVPLVETVQDADDNALEEVREDPFSSLLDGPRDSAADDGETERPPSPQLPETPQEPSPQVPQEVLRAIEEKRRLALEKRRQRLSQLQGSSTSQADPSQTSGSQNSPNHNGLGQSQADPSQTGGSQNSPNHNGLGQTDPAVLSRADTSQPGFGQAAESQAGFGRASWDCADATQADPSLAYLGRVGPDEGSPCHAGSSRFGSVQADPDRAVGDSPDGACASWSDPSLSC
ncbi:TIMELESS-interacting protein isoform X2 [Ixodes scapularis]